MPSRYIIRQYEVGRYYHVFNRGVEKRDIFMDSADYAHFLYLLQRYLGYEVTLDNKYRPLPNYSSAVDLSAYCLMSNHFHLLIYLKEEKGIQELMASVATAYSMYFNKRHNRVGKLFQGRYKAAAITDDTHYQHISRYIHLNPVGIGRNYIEYPYSSIRVWLGIEEASWIKPGEIALATEGGYWAYLEEYIPRQKELKNIDNELGL